MFAVRTYDIINRNCTHGLKQRTCCQNDIPIDVAVIYTEHADQFWNKNNSSPNEPSCTTYRVRLNGVLLVTGTWRHQKVRRESDCKLNLDSRKIYKTTVVVSIMHASTPG
ncbi:hypothetical protein AVEN_179188-1 [Araneus ventricosus]|uniref:Uncharacterized protein n=1 Tax=Araneus ventricosus TaxID=182803 RepID=A0A4Y2C878_ARAVE|nr:hypothetical protein AVEN_179188-1 [Araneus ventricosus]